jgi:hypothetical protein
MTRKQEEWCDRVRRWRASGLTGGDFAEREGVNEATLRHWAWKFGQQGKSEEGPAFVEVVAPVPSRGELEVVVHDDLRIRVPTDFDETTLRRLLAVVESR